MDKVTFEDILREKMGQNRSQKPSPSTPEYPLQQRVSEIYHDLFFLQVDQPARLSFRGYPKTQNSSRKTPSEEFKKSFTPLEKTDAKREKWVKKSQLDEISQSKWGRFENMVGQNFGDSLSKSVVLRSFRSFLKRIHPDLSGGKSAYDFATLVKVKDELVAVLDTATA